MRWFNMREDPPLDNKPKLVYCVPAKGHKQGNEPMFSVAKYCFCSGWSEVVSNWELPGENRHYWDHLHKFEITHWTEIYPPLDDRMSDERIETIPETGSAGVLERT
jgi:hypothetical protein